MTLFFEDRTIRYSIKYVTMTIRLIVLCGLVLLTCCKARKDPEALYYFPNADTTLVGVKNDAGKIIIPAVRQFLPWIYQPQWSTGAFNRYPAA